VVLKISRERKRDGIIPERENDIEEFQREEKGLKISRDTDTVPGEVSCSPDCGSRAL
jgi:hypothetical protein